MKMWNIKHHENERQKVPLKINFYSLQKAILYNIVWNITRPIKKLQVIAAGHEGTKATQVQRLL